MRRARYLCDVSDLVNVYTGQGRNKVILLLGEEEEENNNSQTLQQCSPPVLLLAAISFCLYEDPGWDNKSRKYGVMAGW